MRSILSRIAAAIRAFAARMGSWVKEGGRWVYRMLTPAALPPMDELEPDDVAPANDNVGENQGVRDLVYAQLTGRQPTPQQLGAVTQLQADWIASLDAEMCRRVLRATDAEIRSHVRGNRAIKRVLLCDAFCIDDYATALAIDNARRERDLGLDADGCAPRQPA